MPDSNGDFETGRNALLALINEQQSIHTLSDVHISAAAKGSILVHDGTNWVDLPVGADNEILEANAAEVTGLKWIINTGGGGGEVNLLASLGGGTALTAAVPKSGVTLQTVSIATTAPITHSVSTDLLTFDINDLANADISASAAIDYSKLAALSSANILVGSAANVATVRAVTGDVLISNTGVTSIGAGVIVDADINASAAIALSKLATDPLARANHTGTQTASTISDFDTEVSNNASVVANTAKVSNATHTGDVTGSTALTIAVDAVDIPMLSATGTPDGTTFLRGDNVWAVPAGSGDMVLASIQTSTGKKTFQPDATNAGINLGALAGNPSSSVNGDVHYNSSDDRFRMVQGGGIQIIVGDTAVQTLTNKVLTNPDLNGTGMILDADGDTLLEEISDDIMRFTFPTDSATAGFRFGNEDGYIELKENSAVAGTFTPDLLFNIATGTNASKTRIITQITPANDTGTEPVFIFESEQNDGTDIDTRPLFAIRNNSTVVAQWEANGNPIFTIADDTVQAGVTIENSDGYIRFTNGTGNVNNFKPSIVMGSEGSDHGAQLVGEIPVADDTGTEPVFRVNSRQDDLTPVVTRPLFALANDNTQVWEIGADGNHDLKGNNIFSISNLEFNDSLSEPAGTVAAIYRNSSGNMRINSPTGDAIQFMVNNSAVQQITGTEADIFQNLDLNGNNILNVGGATGANAGAIRLANNVDIAWRNSGDTNNHIIRANSSDEIDLRINNGSQLRVGGTFVTLVGNELHEVGGTTDAGAGAIRFANDALLAWRDSENTFDYTLGVDANERLQYKSTDEESRLDFEMFRDDSTPTDGDQIGGFLARGNTSGAGATSRVFAEFIAESPTVDDATRDGIMRLSLPRNGSFRVNAFVLDMSLDEINIDFGTFNYNDADIHNAGNVVLGGTDAGTSATRTLALVNGTVPTASITNGVQLYAEDVSASSELKVRDEAGNVTTLSPHAFEDGIIERKHKMDWIYRSENKFIGKGVAISIMELAREVESLSGKTLLNFYDIPVEDWDEKQEQIRIDRENEITKMTRVRDRIENQKARLESIPERNLRQEEMLESLVEQLNEFVIPNRHVPQTRPAWFDMEDQI